MNENNQEQQNNVLPQEPNLVVEETPVVEQAYEKIRNEQLKSVNHVQNSKIGVLISFSIFLGIISVISLFLVLRTKNKIMSEPEVIEQEITQVQESTMTEKEEDVMTFSPEKEAERLQKLDIQDIEDFYNKALDEF